MKLNVDMIVGAGLVLALFMSIIFGSSEQLQSNIATGLIGYLGKTAVNQIKQ
jgi:hypothetical protein